MSKRGFLIPFLLTMLLSGCSGPDSDHESDHTHEAESWAVTAWGDRYEIFAETDPLQVATPGVAFTHVTDLTDFSPLVEGVVSVILVDQSGAAVTFSRDEITRPGIYSIEVTPEAVGEFDLVFRVETSVGREDIPAGRVRVGDDHQPGGLLEAASTAKQAEAAAAGAEIPFLKEQQWRTEFATSWVGTGGLSTSVGGPGRVRPAAGGEVLLTSSVEGIVTGDPWPFLGQEVRQGSKVFRVTPRVASGRSLAGLESDVAGLEAELEATSLRLERLEGLLDLGATSQRELEETRSRAVMLESRLTAARRNLATVLAGRDGTDSTTETISVTAPFTGRIARIDATPGQSIAAEVPLGLLVRESPLWVEVALSPEAAAGLRDPEGLDLQLPRGGALLMYRGEDTRLVSVAPAVDPRTGMVRALFEVSANVDELPIGSPVTAEILLAGERSGTVVPSTALVDDGGVPVVYLHTQGESFARIEVEIVGRQGGRALVEGIPSGARVVDRGGNAIRRATLVSKDVGEGHVH